MEIALMPGPSPDDWSFDELAKADLLRSKRLEGAPVFEKIIAQLQDALSEALTHEHYRCGTDSFQGHRRAILQFRVSQELYDSFYNSRSGYRAQFWISPSRGQAANLECLEAMSHVIRTVFPERFDARDIQTTDEPYVGRQDIDVGSREISLSFLTEFLAHPAAKIWICERRITGHEGLLQAIPFFVGKRLSVTRWKTAIASYPSPEWTWLDLKGGFVGGPQPKDSSVRARAIYSRGFS